MAPDPGQKLSPQKHFHCAEHWAVVNGTADSAAGRTRERLYPGRTPLNLIEVQSGPYLWEDDIVRFEGIDAQT